MWLGLCVDRRDRAVRTDSVGCTLGIALQWIFDSAYLRVAIVCSRSEMRGRLLLQGVREFVREQMLTCRTLWVVAAWGEVDVLTLSERGGTDLSGGASGKVIGVNANVTEVSSEAAAHAVQHTLSQWLASAACGQSRLKLRMHGGCAGQHLPARIAQFSCCSHIAHGLPHDDRLALYWHAVRGGLDVRAQRRSIYGRARPRCRSRRISHGESVAQQRVVVLEIRR
ncbi:MAG TPA: hypothetical protein VGV14_01850 [Rhodanobacter sp.]|nr:hypothetical protein [Rhodanobacter sp.]